MNRFEQIEFSRKNLFNQITEYLKKQNKTFSSKNEYKWFNENIARKKNNWLIYEWWVNRDFFDEQEHIVIKFFNIDKSIIMKISLKLKKTKK